MPPVELTSSLLSSISKPNGGDIVTYIGNLFLFGISIVILAATVKLIVAAVKYSFPSPNDKLSGKDDFRTALTAILLLPLLYLTLKSFFPDFLNISNILPSTTGVAQNTTVTTVTPTRDTPSSQRCANPQNIISSLNSESQFCGGYTCTQRCDFSRASFSQKVINESRRQGVNSSYIFALICRESNGDVNATHLNDDKSYDCGLMQVNSKSACSSSLMDVDTNIQKGIETFKQKLAAVARYDYKGFPKEMLAFAAYNCCSTGDPNVPSVDCSPTSNPAFPQKIPKWACPINPGNTKTNMCFVKNYACDVYSCASNYTSF